MSKFKSIDQICNQYGEDLFRKACKWARDRGASNFYPSNDGESVFAYEDGERVDVEGIIHSMLKIEQRQGVSSGDQHESSAGGGVSLGGGNLGISAGDNSSCDGVQIGGVCITSDMIDMYSSLSQH